MMIVRCTPGYGGGDTWCNRFAARVFYLFTGNTSIGTVKNPKLVSDQLDAITSNGWNYLGGLEAGKTVQTEANKGRFIVAISTTPDEHIAVIMPGVGIINSDGIYCPAIAQQGASNILYGYTKSFKWNAPNGYLSYGWDISNNNTTNNYNIRYYEFGGK